MIEVVSSEGEGGGKRWSGGGGICEPRTVRHFSVKGNTHQIVKEGKEGWEGCELNSLMLIVVPTLMFRIISIILPLRRSLWGTEKYKRKS